MLDLRVTGKVSALSESPRTNPRLTVSNSSMRRVSVYMGTIRPNCLITSRRVLSIVVQARPNDSVPPTAVNTRPMNSIPSCPGRDTESEFDIWTTPDMMSSMNTPAAKNGRPKIARHRRPGESGCDPARHDEMAGALPILIGRVEPNLPIFRRAFLCYCVQSPSRVPDTFIDIGPCGDVIFIVPV